MDIYRLDLSSPPNWDPLDRLGLVCAERSTLPVLTPSDFMYAGRLVAANCVPVIHLYKHCRVRSYVCLDASGHAYRVNLIGREVAVSIEEISLHLSRYRPPSGSARDRHH